MIGFGKRIRPHVTAELEQADAAERVGDMQDAFRHMERAHVLGQASTREHVRVHWRMFLWGMKQRSRREVIGQVIRLVGAVTKTAIGLLPHGNTGGSNISPVKPLPVPPDLRRIIDSVK